MPTERTAKAFPGQKPKRIKLNYKQEQNNMKEVLGIKLYSLAEVGNMLGVQRATVSLYVRQGKLKATTIGGHKYVSEENIKDFLNRPDCPEP